MQPTEPAVEEPRWLLRDLVRVLDPGRGPVVAVSRSPASSQAAPEGRGCPLKNALVTTHVLT
jgi:hypothetical protein